MVRSTENRPNHLPSRNIAGFVENQRQCNANGNSSC
ncbi:hypothetical protein EVA_11339 [gut metagenome]|uniref:Uncharacterized protein n=1 Tax=gut metagenome TaxID=749906 RepID=J9G021_9ZZZZ